MRVIIKPSTPHGNVCAPPSKSMAHRMLICAGLAHKSEPSLIFGLEDSQDILATIDCLNVLGAGINRQNDCAAIYGIDSSAVRENNVLPCRECGSTLRFFVPLCLLQDKPLTLTGSPTLMSRPMDVYRAICQQQGLLFSQDEQGIHVQGPLHAGTFTIPGNISSQFISGLLFALPLLDANSTINVVPPVESRPYINMTIEALSLFGVRVNCENGTTLHIPGNQRYQNITAHVEGDYSNAAFLEALNYVGKQRAEGIGAAPSAAPAVHTASSTVTATRATTAVEATAAAARVTTTSPATAAAARATVAAANNPAPAATPAVRVTGLRADSLQGDRAYQELFPALAAGAPTISLADCPDLGPILMAVAAANNGATFTNCKRLAIKESNRGQAMAQELAKFGAAVTVSDDRDNIVVQAGALRAPSLPLDGHNDHRIVMALATLACAVGGTITGAQAVDKSFPDYFKRLTQLGVDLCLEDEHEVD